MFKCLPCFECLAKLCTWLCTAIICHAFVLPASEKLAMLCNHISMFSSYPLLKCQQYCTPAVYSSHISLLLFYQLLKYVLAILYTWLCTYCNILSMLLFPPASEICNKTVYLSMYCNHISIFLFYQLMECLAIHIVPMTNYCITPCFHFIPVCFWYVYKYCTFNFVQQ